MAPATGSPLDLYQHARRPSHLQPLGLKKGLDDDEETTWKPCCQALAWKQSSGTVGNGEAVGLRGAKSVLDVLEGYPARRQFQNRSCWSVGLAGPCKAFWPERRHDSDFAQACCNWLPLTTRFAMIFFFFLAVRTARPGPIARGAL